MIRKFIIAALVLAGLAGGVAAYMLSREEREWTTTSQKALEAFRRGQDAHQKLYNGEALAFYETALDYDDDFVVARLSRLPLKAMSKEEREAERRRIATADLSRLTRREQFMVSYDIARWNGDLDRAGKILDDYLAENPKDSQALFRKCQTIWAKRNFEKAIPCYERILEIDPNFVMAQNTLGYIAMAQGRFADAEDAFRRYRFVAPDQANPHDSLGELLTLLGRYPEAEKELEDGLAIRPDFCPSFEHLVDLHLLQQDFEKANRALARMQSVELCADLAPRYRCKIDYWKAAAEMKWETILEASEGGCHPITGDMVVLLYTAAVRSGRSDLADEIEKKFGRGHEVKLGPGKGAMLLHLEGTRLVAEGKHKEAVERFRKADAEISWSDNQGVFKLYNQISLADALYAAGAREEAEKVAAAVRRVNAPFEAEFASRVSARFRN